jgi:protease IV
VLHLEGDVPEKPQTEMPIPFLEREGNAVTVTEIWRSLERASADNRIKAIIMEPHGTAMGWAKMQEIRADIVKFKKSGKPVYAYLRNPGLREYYLASAADKIYFTPTDVLYIKGLRAELTYYKGTLDKLGVQMEMEHAGKYKDALDSFVRTSMTPETREVMNSFLDDLYGQIVSAIAGSRKKSEAEVRAMIDDGPLLSKAAVDRGLIDGLLFEDQFYDEVKKKAGVTELKKISMSEYSQANRATDTRNKIAILVGDGAITRGSSPTSAFGEEGGITSTSMMKHIRQIRDDSSIKGVILRVDSPGGDAIASDEILREMKLLSQKKPLVISMSDVAASGGYYISMTGDPVLAYPGTITGSIGVIFGKVNLRGLYDKIGVTKESLIRGKNAAIDSEYTALSPEGRKKLKEGIDEIYHTFLGHVASARKKEMTEIEDLAQGRAWLGSQAKSRGLVDELGGLDRSLELIKERAKIGAGEKVALVLYPPKKTLFEQLFSKTTQAVSRLWMVTNVEASQITIPFEKQMETELGFSPRLLLDGRMLGLLPYRMEFR